MKPVFLSCLAVCVLLPTKIHIFEDGFVERTMAVVIRDRTVNVEYAIGLNENTLKQVLKSWENEPGNSKVAISERAASTTQRSDQPTVEKELPLEQASDHSDQLLIPELPESPHESLTDPTNVKDPILKQKPAAVGARPGEQTQNEDGKPRDEPKHIIDAKLFEELQKGAPANISKRIAISCNGQAVTTSSASLGLAPRHPFSLVVRFEFQLPEANVCELEFTDTNFLDQAGAVRYALKTKGRTVILQSDVAPILIRSERVELEPIKKGLAGRPTISAKIAVLPHTKE